MKGPAVGDAGVVTQPQGWSDCTKHLNPCFSPDVTFSLRAAVMSVSSQAAGDPRWPTVASASGPAFYHDCHYTRPAYKRDIFFSIPSCQCDITFLHTPGCLGNCFKKKERKEKKHPLSNTRAISPKSFLYSQNSKKKIKIRPVSDPELNEQ